MEATLQMLEQRSLFEQSSIYIYNRGDQFLGFWERNVDSFLMACCISSTVFALFFLFS